jgi:peptidoglycan/LPS O-acetylase OafA/YrhL
MAVRRLDLPGPRPPLTTLSATTTAPRATAAFAYQPQLDGLRAAAVVAVIVFHARGSWFPGGYIGVDVFFVLSGYLISSILVREHDATGQVSMRRFYVRRALRLVPALVLLSAVVAVAFALVPGVEDRAATLVGVATALTYTSSLVAAAGGDLGWMLPTWSLSVEEYFYVAWPLLLVVLLRRRRPLVWVALLTGLAVVYRLAAGLLSDWSIQRIAYGPDTRAEQLLIGCLLALVLSRGRLRIASWQVLGGVLFLAAFLVVPPDLGGPFYRSGGSTLVALAAALVIGGLSLEPQGWLARIASTRPLVWIGQRSYGLYLWNLPIIGLVAATAVPEPFQMPVKLVLSFVVPALSYRYVEQPFLRLKTRLEPVSGRPRATTPAR